MADKLTDKAKAKMDEMEIKGAELKGRLKQKLEDSKKE